MISKLSVAILLIVKMESNSFLCGMLTSFSTSRCMQNALCWDFWVYMCIGNTWWIVRQQTERCRWYNMNVKHKKLSYHFGTEEELQITFYILWCFKTTLRTVQYVRYDRCKCSLPTGIFPCFPFSFATNTLLLVPQCYIYISCMVSKAHRFELVGERMMIIKPVGECEKG